jgi:hypothetical protein
VLLSKKLLSDLHTVLEPVTDPLERDLYITQVSMTVNVPKNIIYDTLKENPYEECSDESGT